MLIMSITPQWRSIRTVKLPGHLAVIITDSLLELGLEGSQEEPTGL